MVLVNIESFYIHRSWMTGLGIGAWLLYWKSTTNLRGIFCKKNYKFYFATCC